MKVAPMTVPQTAADPRPINMVAARKPTESNNLQHLGTFRPYRLEACLTPSGHGAHFIRRLLLLLCRCSGGEGRNFPIEDAWRKDLIGVLPDDGVAFAGDVPDRRAIEDLDVAAAVADQARAL